MGIDTQAVRLLLEARQSGVRFGRLATLGRQNYFPSDAETRREFRRAGLDAAGIPGLLGHRELPRYADHVWRALGAESVDAVDASDYEGATVIHDMNRPIPDALRGRFDVVYDGGSLEHIFNVPVALANCMEMVDIGGRVIHFTPANNQFGHGFYQFSPELFFRVFSEEQGFRVERMVAVEGGPRYRRFLVSDPREVRARVTLVNAYPVSLYIQAIRMARVTPFQTIPQQSDYVPQWNDGRPVPHRSGVAPLAGRPDLRHVLKERLPGTVRFLEGVWASARNPAHSFANRRNFKPLR